MSTKTGFKCIKIGSREYVVVAKLSPKPAKVRLWSAWKDDTPTKKTPSPFELFDAWTDL